MVPVEITAFGLLATCVIVLAAILFVALVFPRDAALMARYVFVPAWRWWWPWRSTCW